MATGRPHGHMLDTLKVRAEQANQAERELFVQLDWCRENGVPWTDIAAAIGLGSKQAAQQRFSRMRRRFDSDQLTPEES